MSAEISAELIDALRMASDICVFTSGYPPGACCIGVAGTVAATLCWYGVDARVVAGGLCYRAGPNPKWDVAAFCGAAPLLTGQNADIVFIEGMRAGHVYHLKETIVTNQGVRQDQTITLRCDQQ